MDKRYQVFVSSTYANLKEERQHVIQSLIDMDCIPVGMDLSPVTEHEQWECIKKVIDDCDYYLLIIGDRYGSTTSDSIGYSEKEFDYAVDKGLKVVALINGEPNDIPFGKSEQDPMLREKLLQFKTNVMGCGLVKFWNAPKDLPDLVSLSLTKTIKAHPAIGWVRASSAASEDLLLEINELRKNNSNQLLKIVELVKDANNKPIYDGIADIDSTFTVHVEYEIHATGFGARKRIFACTISWRDMFVLIAPYLMEHPTDFTVKWRLALILKELEPGNIIGDSITINDQEFKTITIQFRAYGLIDTSYLETSKGNMALFWSLTPRGERLMIESRVIKGEVNN